ncbi:NAD-dependent epimerase/dehydratase family protein [Burkholderia singularis]|uniref:UDP-glucose 4-epimerase n=1 Tax=Burkholderia singularis TaxID=1503053 RepID=A0A238H7I8_9BURK|nr:NAD-dependent epimerase/dehydratase family protein [Burkholderia singularis]SMG01306.1 UDP-glucose 4-epimerase [Burkholderia singularis]
MSHIIVTGANGFVGRALCRLAMARGHRVTALGRTPSADPIPGVQPWVHAAADFDGLGRQWPVGLKADCVVHLAARVHVMREEARHEQAAFDATNVDGALRVAQAAHDHGVPRFVFVSSIKAVAEVDGGVALTEQAVAAPRDAYGRSKLKAEQALDRLAAATGLDVVVMRPPLVYGPEVRANFLRMMDAVWAGWPLPLGALDARRSMVYVDNLADALLRCALDPRAARGCFHIADDDDPPTLSALLRMLGGQLGRPARLLPVPAGVLRTLGHWTRRGEQIERLTENLRVSSAHLRQTLGWLPPCTMRDGLAATATWYRSERQRAVRQRAFR